MPRLLVPLIAAAAVAALMAPPATAGRPACKGTTVFREGTLRVLETTRVRDGERVPVLLGCTGARRGADVLFVGSPQVTHEFGLFRRHGRIVTWVTDTTGSVSAGTLVHYWDSRTGRARFGDGKLTPTGEDTLTEPEQVVPGPGGSLVFAADAGQEDGTDLVAVLRPRGRLRRLDTRRADVLRAVPEGIAPRSLRVSPTGTVSWTTRTGVAGAVVL